MEQRRQEQLEEQYRTEREEEEEEEVLQGQEEELRLEMKRMTERGHQEKVNCVDSWETSRSQIKTC